MAKLTALVALFALILLSDSFGMVSGHKTSEAKCPKDTLKLGVCGSWLGLVHETIGSKPSKECCTLIQGIADLEAAACLCTALKANVIVANVQVPVAVSLLLSACGKKVPPGFQCA